MKENVEKVIKALNKNNIKARYFEDAESAMNVLLDEINVEESVGIGGSMTISQLGIPEKLKKRGNKVYFHWLESTPEDVDKARLLASRADVYLTSTNALTEKGQLVNIDGIGNRVTSMVYGPKKVFVLCGMNKITKDLDDALEHIKSNTYRNARRLKLNTPCAITGKCNDCDSPQRMCNVTVIIEKKPDKVEIEVMIINKELGY